MAGREGRNIKQMNIYDPKNRLKINAIKFCLNWASNMKLISIKYVPTKEIYKVRVFDPAWGAQTTCKLTKKFVDSAVVWINSGKNRRWI
jgi:hypothetical protein